MSFRPSSVLRGLRAGMLAAAVLVAGVIAVPSAGAAVAPAACTGTNLARNHPAAASSTENGGTPASAAVDGNTGTRWSSAFSDPQWLRVDLGATATVCQVVLNWEAAYARAFQLQVSADATNWTTIYSTYHRHRRHADAGRHRLRPLPAGARHGAGHALRLLALGALGRRDRWRRQRPAAGRFLG